MLNVRRLTLDDLDAYRTVRLQALEHAPEAFGSTLAREQSFTRAEFAARLANGATLGAFAGFYAQTGEKDRHKGHLVGMYVCPPLRRTGAGRALVEAILERAASQVEQVHLDVISENHAARRLYQSCGFTAYGTEPRALKQNGHYFDSVLMVRFVAPNPGAPDLVAPAR